ncbi:hypothetical protein AGMMS50256_34970 [Betaproteobacteria bacterium]|nr:hypothetical protein AGMMS50256_34970 [Betaproteobacteria bacterium]
MAAITFDTLQFVQRLKKAGVKEPEAEAIAEAVRDVQASADVATKQDLANLATKQDLASVEAKLEVKIAETKADLVKWVVSVGVLQTAMIGALLLKLIPN